VVFDAAILDGPPGTFAASQCHFDLFDVDARQ